MSIYELVFHTTSGASRSGPPSTYLNVFTVYIIWVSYNNSLTWNKVIWGYFPLLTMNLARSQWGRYNLPIMYKKDSVSTPPGMDGTISLPVTKKTPLEEAHVGRNCKTFQPDFYGKWSPWPLLYFCTGPTVKESPQYLGTKRSLSKSLGTNFLI